MRIVFSGQSELCPPPRPDGIGRRDSLTEQGALRAERIGTAFAIFLGSLPQGKCSSEDELMSLDAGCSVRLKCSLGEESRLPNRYPRFVQSLETTKILGNSMGETGRQAWKLKMARW